MNPDEARHNHRMFYLTIERLRAQIYLYKCGTSWGQGWPELNACEAPLRALSEQLAANAEDDDYENIRAAAWRTEIHGG